MLTPVNMESTVAAYVQIENHVRYLISAGVLKEGDLLPSVRVAAGKCGVNANTVTKAYRDLELMNIVQTRRGVGVTVAPGGEKLSKEFVRNSMPQKIFEATREAAAAGFTLADIQKIVKESKGVDCGPYDAAPDTVLKLARSLN